MNTIMNNIHITIPGLGSISISAYEELVKTQVIFEEGDDFFMEKVNPYFTVALYAYYKAKKNALAALLKKEMTSVNWFFYNFNSKMNLEYRNTNLPFMVTIRNNHEYPNEDSYTDYYYTNEKAWEVIRDICIPAVKNFQ